MVTTTSKSYATAMHAFKTSGNFIKPPDSNPVLWNLSNGLWHLAEAIQKDMEETKARLAAIEGDISRLKRQMPPPQ